MSVHTVSCQTRCHVTKCHVTKCHVTECHVTECHVTKCHVSKCHITECHFTECHFTKCHIECQCHVCNQRGAPKTCDIAALAVHFLQDGWESHKEPLDCRFDHAPGQPIECFSVGYVLGFSRALAGISLVDAALSLHLDANQVSQVSREFASLQLVWCTYDPATDVEDRWCNHC